MANETQAEKDFNTLVKQLTKFCGTRPTAATLAVLETCYYIGYAAGADAAVQIPPDFESTRLCSQKAQDYKAQLGGN